MKTRTLEKLAYTFMHNRGQRKPILTQVYNAGGKSLLLRFSEITGWDIREINALLYNKPNRKEKRKQGESGNVSFGAMASKDIYHRQGRRTRENDLVTHIKDFK